MSPKAKGYMMILASAVCFSLYGVWSRILGMGFGVFFQAWVRSLMILVILLPIAIARKELKPVKKEDRKWFLATMIFTVFTQAPLYFAFNRLPLGTATFIFYGFFLISCYAIGCFFLSEKITLIKISSFILSLFGLLLTFGLSFAQFSIWAMILAGLNGIASGGEIATSKKSIEKYSALHLSIYSWIFIFATHLPLSLLFGEKQFIPTWNVEWFVMLGYAASGLLGFWLIMEGFRYADASIGALIGLLEIVFAVFLGIFLFNDQISASVVFGGIIIIAAAVLPDIYALKWPKKEKPLPPPPPI